MDLTGEVRYRDLIANVVEITPPDHIDQGISGVTIRTANLSDIDVVQYADKSAIKDGVDMGDVYLGGRSVELVGTIYETTRAKLFDQVQLVRRTFNARSAYLQDPTLKGFLPFYYSVPTDSDEFDSHIREHRMYVIPRSVNISFDSKATGGKDADELSVPWRATLVARDPLQYGEQMIVALQPFGSLQNRGDFEAVFDADFEVGSAAGTISLTIGSVTMVITVPTGAAGRTIHYNGRDRLLTMTEGGINLLRMDLLATLTHPTIPAGGGTYSYSATADIDSAQLEYLESYA